MSLFGRREPLHERLAREGGLPGEPVGEDTRAPWDKAGIHGVQRPREWDAVVTVETELDADSARFVALGDELVIEEGPDDVSELADAVETRLEPPYRAEAVRRGVSTWAVAARRIRVVELDEEVEGDELELTLPGDRAPDALGALAQGPAFVEANRIDGTLWEVRVTPL